MKLTMHKHRSRQRMYLIEGLLLIKDAMRSGAAVTQIILKDDGELADPRDGIPPEMLEEILAGDIPIFVLRSDLFDKLSQTENGRNIIAVVEMREQGDSFPVSAGRSHNAVILDRLQDPGNIGTIIRTADGAGFGAVIVLKGTADIYSPKVVRAAAGSLFRIPIMEAETPAELKEILDSMELRLVVTDMAGETAYWDEDISTGIGLVVGNEGSGVSEELKSMADTLVSLPMCGEIDSLNASVAAAVVMYESMRQRRLKGTEEKENIFNL